jgi:hypothetical protein
MQQRRGSQDPAFVRLDQIEKPARHKRIPAQRFSRKIDQDSEERGLKASGFENS